MPLTLAGVCLGVPVRWAKVVLGRSDSRFQGRPVGYIRPSGVKLGVKLALAGDCGALWRDYVGYLSHTVNGGVSYALGRSAKRFAADGSHISLGHTGGCALRRRLKIHSLVPVHTRYYNAP